MMNRKVVSVVSRSMVILSNSSWFHDDRNMNGCSTSRSEVILADCLSSCIKDERCHYHVITCHLTTWSLNSVKSEKWTNFGRSDRVLFFRYLYPRLQKSRDLVGQNILYFNFVLQYLFSELFNYSGFPKWKSRFEVKKLLLYSVLQHCSTVP